MKIFIYAIIHPYATDIVAVKAMSINEAQEIMAKVWTKFEFKCEITDEKGIQDLVTIRES